MYDQLIAPNLRVTGTPGLCLTYVRNMYNIPPKYAYATLAWENAQFKQAGEQPPSDVSVPVWFSWTGTVSGVRQDWGHVAEWVPGVGIYSVSAQGDKIFGSLAQLESYIGCSYLGWSEDIDGVRVVEPASAPPAPAGHDETVSAGTWYVRSAPSVSSVILGTIKQGEVFATTLDGDWRAINFNGRTGYVGPAAWAN